MQQLQRGLLEQPILALGNALALLDGQGVQRYPDDLCTQLRIGLKDCRAGDAVVLPYLQVKPYRNGNAHLVFTRHDLIDRLNQVATDGTGLPGKEA